MAVCLCVQHQSLFGLSDLFHGRQVDLALEGGRSNMWWNNVENQAVRRDIPSSTM